MGLQQDKDKDHMTNRRWQQELGEAEELLNDRRGEAGKNFEFHSAEVRAAAQRSPWPHHAEF
jgi:hypothetical protein